VHVAIEGADGAGKTTLIAGLTRRLSEEGRGFILVNKYYQVRTTGGPSTLDDDLVQRFKQLQPVTYGPFPDGRHLWGDHHWLFALGSWYSLLDTTVIAPALAEGLTVIVDNPHYKTLARYMLKPDFPVESAWQVFSHLRTPELVAFLDVDAKTALTRKGQFESIEAGFTGNGTAHFLTHQRDLACVLRAFASRWGWKTIDTSDLEPAAVLDRVHSWI
jgi:thymidylate kinase